MSDLKRLRASLERRLRWPEQIALLDEYLAAERAAGEAERERLRLVVMDLRGGDDVHDGYPCWCTEPQLRRSQEEHEDWCTRTRAAMGIDAYPSAALREEAPDA